MNGEIRDYTQNSVVSGGVQLHPSCAHSNEHVNAALTTVYYLDKCNSIPSCSHPTSRLTG